jgi:hypothetical protein
MQVTSVGTTSPVDTMAEIDDTTTLTPDALFAYCQSQMNNIDGQANGYFADAKNNNDMQNKIVQVMAEVRKLQTESSADGDPAVNSIQSELQGIVDNLSDPKEKAAVQSAIGVLMTGNDTKVSDDEAQKVIDTLTSVNSQLGSDNQMTMIHLQSAMSQREQAIQLTTNMLQTINDCESKVIANIHP